MSHAHRMTGNAIDEGAGRRASTLLLILVATFITLIALGLAAIAAGIALRRGSRLAARIAIAVSWGYIFVVLLDLGHVFPVSSDPIPLLLGLIEILDAILAGYVMVLAHRALGDI